MFRSDDVYDPDYGCGFGDLVCSGQESIAKTMASAIKSMGDFIADMFKNAFEGTNIPDTWWHESFEQFWFWTAIMVPVVLVVMMYQLVVAMILHDGRRMGSSVVGGIAAVSCSGVAVMAMQKLTGFTDGVTSATLSMLQDGDMSDALLTMSGIKVVNKAAESDATSQPDAEVTSNSALHSMMTEASSAGSVGSLIWAAVLLALMALVAGVLYIMMTIRDFGLLALAAMAPIAWMLVGQTKFGAWAERWVSMTLGLIVAKPLAAGVLVLATQLTGADGEGVTIGMFIVACGAIFAAALSPFWAVKLVSFAGAETGNAMQRRASATQHVQKAQTAKSLVKK